MLNQALLKRLVAPNLPNDELWQSDEHELIQINASQITRPGDLIALGQYVPTRLPANFLEYERKLLVKEIESHFEHRPRLHKSASRGQFKVDLDEWLSEWNYLKILFASIYVGLSPSSDWSDFYGQNGDAIVETLIFQEIDPTCINPRLGRRDRMRANLLSRAKRLAVEIEGGCGDALECGVFAIPYPVTLGCPHLWELKIRSEADAYRLRLLVTNVANETLVKSFRRGLVDSENPFRRLYDEADQDRILSTGSVSSITSSISRA